MLNKTTVVVDAGVRPGFPGPLEFLASAWRHRQLIRRLTRRQIESRYKGSVLGVLWAFIVPLMMLAVFTFVFSVVFKIRWGVDVEGRGQFALVLFSGLIVFNLFAHCVTQAPTMLLQNTNLIKKVVFPLEILPWIVLAEGIFNAVISYLVFFAVYFPVLGIPPATTFLLPFILIPLSVFLLGAIWFLASTGVYVRDLSQGIGVVATMFMFLSPVFYPLAEVPPKFRVILYMSPLTLVIRDVRNAVFWADMPHWGFWFASLAVAWAVAWFGFVWFMKTKKGFADVV